VTTYEAAGAFVKRVRARSFSVTRPARAVRSFLGRWSLPVAGLTAFTVAAASVGGWAALLAGGTSCFILDYLRGAGGRQ
jgi:hypothetical protein